MWLEVCLVQNTVPIAFSLFIWICLIICLAFVTENLASSKERPESKLYPSLLLKSTLCKAPAGCSTSVACRDTAQTVTKADMFWVAYYCPHRHAEEVGRWQYAWLNRLWQNIWLKLFLLLHISPKIQSMSIVCNAVMTMEGEAQLEKELIFTFNVWWSYSHDYSSDIFLLKDS